MTVLRDPESGTFAASWRAIHARPPSAYLYSSPYVVHNVLICFVFGVIILQWRVDRYGITRHQQSNLGPSQHCNLLSQSITLPEDHCSQKFLQSSCGWRNLIPSRPHREHAFPNSHMVPLSISHATRVTQTTNIGLKKRLPRARRLRGSFSIIPLKVGCLFPFLKSLTVKKLLFVEYLSF